MRDLDDPLSFVFRKTLRSVQVFSGQEVHSLERSEFIRTECCDAPIYHAERIFIRLSTVLRCAQCHVAIDEHADDFLTDLSWITTP